MSSSSANAQHLSIHDIDVSDPGLYERDQWQPVFARLRAEDPVHFCAQSAFGSYWSITRFDDIVEIEKAHEAFSSEPSILIGDAPNGELVNFINMDPPRHDEQRMTVQGLVSPINLATMESTIRARAAAILDSLPIGTEFNWVDRVSVELTTQVLAMLFDFPFEERRKLTYWSDIAVGTPELTGGTFPEAERQVALTECVARFTTLWHERAAGPPAKDFLSLMVHGAATKEALSNPMELIGNLLLLIVGGNDTTRNSISGGVVALNTFPAEYDKLRADRKLIPNMVSEIIRFQTPLIHMRRLATRDTEFRGKRIRKGEKVVMWYVSGNRDESAIDRADEFLIDRANARHHLSFGFGIHRCMGNRLAELQLRVLWEEIMNRFSRVEMVGEPVRVRSNMFRGFIDVPVRLHAW